MLRYPNHPSGFNVTCPACGVEHVIDRFAVCPNGMCDYDPELYEHEVARFWKFLRLNAQVAQLTEDFLDREVEWKYAGMAREALQMHRTRITVMSHVLGVELNGREYLFRPNEENYDRFASLYDAVHDRWCCMADYGNQINLMFKLTGAITFRQANGYDVF